MIPHDYITEWRAQAPWIQDFQVEQDLVICRALVEMFSHPLLRESVAFRGGTALYKLHLRPPARYSEDIDLVQITAGPAGPVIDAFREVLDSWLGEPRRKQSEGRVTLNYRFDSEDQPPIRLRLKVEINTREHFALFGFLQQPFSVSSRWFSGGCNITTFTLDELLATKLRALYQRKKGRDLFDLATALESQKVDVARVVDAFQKYMQFGGDRVSRAEFEENLQGKLQDSQFITDIGPLLVRDSEWEIQTAAEVVNTSFIARLPGESWRGNEAGR